MSTMSPITISMLVFAFVFSGGLLGTFIHSFCQASISTRIPRTPSGSGWHWSGRRSHWCWDC